MTKVMKAIIILTLIVTSIGYIGSGMIFGFDNVNTIVGIRADNMKEKGFMKLSPQEMRQLISGNLKKAERGADNVIEEMLAKEEELASRKAQRAAYEKELAQLKSMLKRAIEWADANPNGTYRAADGTEYSFADVSADVAKKTQRVKALSGFIAQLNQQITRYEQFVFTAKTKVDDYLAQVAKVKTNADVALTDLTLRQGLANSYSDLNDGESISANNFTNVEQMLSFVQNKLRAYDAIEYRQARAVPKSGLDYGVIEETKQSPFDEAREIISGKKTTAQNSKQKPGINYFPESSSNTVL